MTILNTDNEIIGKIIFYLVKIIRVNDKISTGEQVVFFS